MQKLRVGKLAEAQQVDETKFPWPCTDFTGALPASSFQFYKTVPFQIRVTGPDLKPSKKCKFLSTVFSCLVGKKKKATHSRGLSTMAVTCTLGFLRMVFRGNRDGSSPFHSSQGSPKHIEVSFQFCAAFYFFL